MRKTEAARCLREIEVRIVSSSDPCEPHGEYVQNLGNLKIYRNGLVRRHTNAHNLQYLCRFMEIIRPMGLGYPGIETPRRHRKTITWCR